MTFLYLSRAAQILTGPQLSEYSKTYSQGGGVGIQDFFRNSRQNKEFFWGKLPFLGDSLPIFRGFGGKFCRKG